MAYDKLFEIISKRKLTNQSAVDKAIRQDIPLSALIPLAVDLGLSIEAESSVPSMLGLQDYHFLANSNMSALYEGGCTYWKCRLDRLDRLSRFAALYSDAVYIQSYFDWFNHPHIPEDSYQEYHLRKSISGSIKIINAIRPLIQNNIVRFLPAGKAVCKTCYAELMQKQTALNAQLAREIRRLEKLYSQSTSANLKVLSAPSPIDGHVYETHVTCDEDLFDHGNYVLATPDLPPVLRRKTLRKPSPNEYRLSSSDILRSHLIRICLENIAADVSCLQFHCSDSNLKYLTNRTIDISVLQATTQEDNLLNYNHVLSTQLMFEMPVFSDISLSSLLKIRANEYDAFTSYRQTINHLLNQYIAKGRQLSPKIAKQIYSDIVQPNVLALDKRISSIRRSAIRRSITNLGISAGFLTFGLCGNLLPSNLQNALFGAGLVQAVNTARSLPAIINAPTQLRNHNFYFVWKLSKMSKLFHPK